MISISNVCAFISKSVASDSVAVQVRPLVPFTLEEDTKPNLSRFFYALFSIQTRMYHPCTVFNRRQMHHLVQSALPLTN